MKEYLTEEQCKQLVKLGYDVQTADCFYYAQQRFDGNEYVNTGVNYFSHRNDKWGDEDEGYDGEEHFQDLLKNFGAAGKYDDEEDYFIPCWSCLKLMELLPIVEYSRGGMDEDGVDDTHIEKVEPFIYRREDKKWVCTHEMVGIFHDGIADELIDAVYEHFIWLINVGLVEVKED